jgi:hypothetical protein
VAGFVLGGYPAVTATATSSVGRITGIAIRFWNLMAISRNQKLFPHFGETGTAIFAVKKVKYGGHNCTPVVLSVTKILSGHRFRFISRPAEMVSCEGQIGFRALSNATPLTAERPGCLEVHDQLERGRLQDRQIGGLCALKDLAGVRTRVAIGAAETGAVDDGLAERVDRGTPLTRRQPDDLFSSIEFLRVVPLSCALARAFSPSLGGQFPPCNPGPPKS